MLDGHGGNEAKPGYDEKIVMLEKLTKTPGNEEKITILVKEIEEEALPSDNHVIVMKAFGLVGNYFFRQDSPEKLVHAEKQYRRALKIALDRNDPLAAKFYNKLGNVFVARKDPLTANDYFNKGLTHAGATGNLLGELFSLYFMGKNYFKSEEIKDRNLAVKCFRKAFFKAVDITDRRERLDLMNMTLGWWVEGLNWADPGEAEKSAALLSSLARKKAISERLIIKEQLAGLNKQLGDFEQAEAIYKDLIAEIDQHVSEDRQKNRFFLYNRLFVSNSLAFLYSSQGEYQKAIDIFRSNSLRSITDLNDTYHATFCRSNLAFALTAKGELLEARRILEKVIKESKTAGDQKSLAYSLGGLGWLHGFTDTSKALSYYSQSIELFEQLEIPVPVKIVSSVATSLLEQEEPPKVANKTVKHYLHLLARIQPESPEYPRRLIVEAKRLVTDSKGRLEIEKAKDLLLRAYLHAQKSRYRELEVGSLLEMIRLELDQDPPNIPAVKENLDNLVEIAEKDGIKHLLAETWLVQGLLDLHQQEYSSARVYFEKTNQLAGTMQYRLIKEKCDTAINNLSILTKATDLYTQLSPEETTDNLTAVYDLEDALEDAREYIRKVTIITRQFQQQDRWKNEKF